MGFAAGTNPALARIGLVEYADDGLRAIIERNQRSPLRHPAHERTRAINGIDHPGQAGRTGLEAILLAHDPVLGIARANELSDFLFRASVSFGHGIKPARGHLVVDGNAIAEVGEDNLARDIREFARKRTEVVEF